MPGVLYHSPADIIATLLIGLGLGTDPETGPLVWPVYATNEPDTPDNVITVYDTAGKTHGRDMVTGEMDEHHGIQVKVRSSLHDVGYVKAHAIARALDTQVDFDTVVLDTSTYKVQTVVRTSDVLPLGKEVQSKGAAGGTQRRVFTVNALAMLRLMTA